MAGAPQHLADKQALLAGQKLEVFQHVGKQQVKHSLFVHYVFFGRRAAPQNDVKYAANLQLAKFYDPDYHIKSQVNFFIGGIYVCFHY